MSELDAYNYDLPRHLIAQHPLPCRSAARLLVVSRADASLTHARMHELPSFLRAGDGLVLNDTRVVPARLSGYRRETGGRWSGLFLAADPAGHWCVLSKTRGKLRAGEQVVLQDPHGCDREELTMVARLDGGVWTARPGSREPSVDVLARVGRVPLPPYIRGGQMQSRDVERYQTVFARQPGAVAAPTAGLHFTPELLAQLADHQVARHYLTLHVGIGTFRPVTTARLDEHVMHGEWGRVDSATVDALQACRRAGGRVIAVGTTCVRVLETAARDGTLRPWEGVTDLFIRPPYRFQAVDALLTNFHLPRSTLLVLVRAFGGDDLVRHAYQVAIQEHYRFYSYGDAMLIL